MGRAVGWGFGRGWGEEEEEAWRGAVGEAGGRRAAQALCVPVT